MGLSSFSYEIKDSSACLFFSLVFGGMRALPTFYEPLDRAVAGSLICVGSAGGCGRKGNRMFLTHACFCISSPRAWCFILCFLSEDRVRKGAEKLNKMMNAKQQGRLDGFFTVKSSAVQKGNSGGAAASSSSKAKAGAKRKVGSLSFFASCFVSGVVDSIGWDSLRCGRSSLCDWIMKADQLLV